ncbi:hypothetical protein MKK65_22240 [Methylobacterium sp. J-001]|uniref:hypothetical protein n=1 Tax=Methylobacterium sp. J-001 TaxID=2836609 RepID=UPI001FBAEF12|nr:hypothetical protein [Methylobacterium sp. J-001]MCJ2119256.1 hypothetical protein [Methylobacterium sp. J-001]
MSDRDDEPTALNTAIAAQIYAARIRGAYSIETLAVLARVDPEAIVGLENGAPLIDAGVRGRVMDVLGLRSDGHSSPVRLTDLTLSDTNRQG